MSLNPAAGLGPGGNENDPDLLRPYEGFPDAAAVVDGHISMPELRAAGSRARRA